MLFTLIPQQLTRFHDVFQAKMYHQAQKKFGNGKKLMIVLYKLYLVKLMWLP